MFSSDLFITSARRLCFRRIYLLPPPGGYVFVGFIYLFICLSARLRKNLQADLDETLWVSWP